MKLLILIMTLLFSISSWAQKLEVNATIKLYSEFEELNLADIKEASWSVKEDSEREKTFTFRKIIPYSKLEIKKELGPAYFSISQSGIVEIGIVNGDLDSASVTSIQLPSSNGKLIPLSAPLKIKNTGGDYASSLWDFEGELILTPVK